MRRGCGCLASAQLIVVGVILTAVGIGLLVSSLQKRADFVETTGVVVDLIRSTDSDGDTYAPIIEYTAIDGQTYRLESEFYRSPRPEIGDRLGVLYNPRDPTDATEDSLFVLWIFPVIAIVIGIPVGAFGFFLVRRALRGPRKPRRERVTVPSTPTPAADVPAETQEDSVIVGDRPTRAQFRRVEPRGPDSNGNFEYRVVARDEDGTRYYSEWISEDPTTAMLSARITEVDLEWRDGVGRVVGFPTSTPE